MAFGSWIIETVLKLNNTSFLSGMTRSTEAMSAADIRMARLQGRMTTTEAQFLTLGNSVARARSEMNATINSGAAIGFAAIAAGIGYAADQAARFQRTLIAIKNETGANPAAMAGFYDTIFNISNRMGVTPGEGANVMLDISRLTAGQLTPQQMQAIAPHIADVASAINFNRPDVSVKEATDSIIQLVHMNRAYTQSAMMPLADKLYRLMGLMVETPQQAVRQMSYYEPLFKGSGVNTDTEIATMAILDRAGFRNKVGTGVAASLLEALGPLQLTKHFEQGQGKILTQMGIFKNGKFDVYNAQGGVDYVRMMRDVFNWSQIQESHGMKQAEVERLIYGAFQKQGGRVMSLFADPTIAGPVTGALAEIIKYLHDPNVGVNAALKNRNESVGYQFSRAVSNLNAVMVELGFPWLTDLAHFFKGLGDSLHGLQAWLHQHRDAEKAIGAIFTGIATFLGGVAVVGGASQILKFLGVIKEIPNAFELVLSPFARFIPLLGAVVDIPFVGWVVGIGAALWLLGTHTKQVEKFVNDAANWIVHTGFPAVRNATEQLVTAVLQGIATWGPQIAGFFRDHGVDIVKFMFGGWIPTIAGGTIGFGKDLGRLWNDTQGAQKGGWYSLSPSERSFMWSRGYKPSQFGTQGGPASVVVQNPQVTINAGAADAKQVGKIVHDLLTNPQHYVKQPPKTPNLPFALATPPN